MIHFDLDGVSRHLSKGLFNGEIDTWDKLMKTGQNFCDYIDEHLEILMTAPATRFCATIKKLKEVHIISHQPDHWKPGTMYWLGQHFKNNRLIIDFVKSPQEKMAFLSNGDLLVEDYPKFEDYSKIILIDWPYNRHVKDPYARITEPEQLKKIIFQ